MQGSGPEGDRPFLDLLDIESGRVSERLWQSSGAGEFSQPGGLMTEPAKGAKHLKLDGLAMLMSRETQLDPPQSSLRIWRRAAPPDPAPHPSAESASPPATFLPGSPAADFVGRPPTFASDDRLLTSFPHPYPALRDLQKEIIRYKVLSQK